MKASIFSTENGAFGTYSNDDDSVVLPITNINGDANSEISAVIGDSGWLRLGKWEDDGNRYGTAKVNGVPVAVRAMICTAKTGRDYLFVHGPWTKPGGKVVANRF